MAEQSAQPMAAEGLIGLVSPQYDEHNLPPGSSPNKKPNYDELKADQEGKQAYDWSALIFWIKYGLVIFATVIAVLVILAVLALVGWFIYIFVIHYTRPDSGWLNDYEFRRLGALYGNFAKFAAPTALIANAWLVAFFGTRRWATSNKQRQNEASK